MPEISHAFPASNRTPLPVIVALDVPEAERALALVETLYPIVSTFKVGFELFTANGPDIVREIRRQGGSVFLDLKLHDIPNTVAKATAAAVRLDVQMLSLHTSGGLEMMRAAENAAQTTARGLGRSPPLLLGVTVLTSLNAADLRKIGIDRSVRAQVEGLAKLALRAGLSGLVCSPFEVPSLRRASPPSLCLVTPGIRTARDGKGDQKRSLSAEAALAAGANWLVVGRPIYHAPDPLKAIRNLCRSIGRPVD